MKGDAGEAVRFSRICARTRQATSNASPPPPPTRPPVVRRARKGRGLAGGLRLAVLFPFKGSPSFFWSLPGKTKINLFEHKFWPASPWTVSCGVLTQGLRLRVLAVAMAAAAARTDAFDAKELTD